MVLDAVDGMADGVSCPSGGTVWEGGRSGGFIPAVDAGWTGGMVPGAVLATPTGPPPLAPIGVEVSGGCVLSRPTLFSVGCEMIPMLAKAEIGDWLACAGWPVVAPVAETGLEADLSFPRAARGMLPRALPDIEDKGAVLVEGTVGPGPVCEGGGCGLAGDTKLLLSTEERTGADGAEDMEEKTLDCTFAEAPATSCGTLLRG